MEMLSHGRDSFARGGFVGIISQQVVDGTGYTATFEGGVDGILMVDFVLNAFSHTHLEELNPLSFGTIFGSVGGAWGERKI